MGLPITPRVPERILVSNVDEPDKKPPPQKTVAWNPDEVPELDTEQPTVSPPAPADPPLASPDPGATVMFTPEDVERLKKEQAAAAAAEEDDRLIGTLIRDKWRVLEKLGAGSFGTVYKVEDVKGGWIEALKILGVDRMTGAEAEEMRARFLREAQIMKRLGGDSHNIVGLSTYEEDIESGLIYFLMEFVEGRSLADALAEEGPFSVDRTVRIALQVCDALMAAHEGPEPVVHRDLKLENLMLTKDRSGDEMVKVLDFGIAKIAEREADSRLTTVGTLGTPGYAAPEQLRAEAVDGRTDLFAFGVILYALLTGHDPWLGNLAHEPTHQIYELMVATDRAEVRPMSGVGTKVPPTMVNVVMKLLRRNPAQRFQSARELHDALRSIASGVTDAGGGTLHVTTAEPGIRVEVRDGRNVVAEGPTPCSAAGVPAGHYIVAIRDPRYEPAEAAVTLAAGAIQDVELPSVRRSPTSSTRPAPTQKKSGKGRLAVAVVLLLVAGAVSFAQPWGRTLDRDALLTQVDRGAILQVYLTEGGLEGGLRVVPVDALADVRMPFYVDVGEGDMPEVVRTLRERGVSVDASWEIRRLTTLAVQAQERNRYYGLDGGDVRSYALRLAELEPDSQEAASFLFKVGERMAWDADAAIQEGAAERAAELVSRCLDLVPDQPRCVAVSRML
ncbi:MAG: serine/threonine protein kinase [Gemmatimonadetes bacterium]|nr:serine/threonine protein kinase [Gemmatimonadota bacterium]